MTEQLQATVDAVHGHVLLLSGNNSNDSKVYQELVWLLHIFLIPLFNNFPDY